MAIQPDAELFLASARVVELRLGEFNAQNFANTVWAFATAIQSDAALFQTLSRAVKRCLGSAQNLANIAWAFATLERHHTNRVHCSLQLWQRQHSGAWTSSL